MIVNEIPVEEEPAEAVKTEDTGTGSDIDDIPTQHVVVVARSAGEGNEMPGKAAAAVEDKEEEEEEVVKKQPRNGAGVEVKGEDQGHALMPYAQQYSTKLSDNVRQFGACPPGAKRRSLLRTL